MIGDSGTANKDAAAVYNAYLKHNGDRYTDLWLMLGDNAYNSGKDSEYQKAVFDIYPEILGQTPLWPTIGNHDAKSIDHKKETGIYYNIFTLPKKGEVGGTASGTESYYSFDYANIHFLCLSSIGLDRSVGAPMYNWAKKDLAETKAKWVIAYFHHPTYTKGSHDSDTEKELIEMRENFLPMLEDAGIDLVLTGHSHTYERSHLIDGPGPRSPPPPAGRRPGRRRPDPDGFRPRLRSPRTVRGQVHAEHVAVPDHREHDAQPVAPAFSSRPGQSGAPLVEHQPGRVSEGPRAWR